jgi:hypothetical protein
MTDNPRVHLRIEKEAVEPGHPHVVRDDQIYAVAADGTAVDISRCVTEWREISKVGEPRRVEVILLGFHVTEQDGSERFVSEVFAE